MAISRLSIRLWQYQDVVDPVLPYGKIGSSGTISRSSLRLFQYQSLTQPVAIVIDTAGSSGTVDRTSLLLFQYQALTQPIDFTTVLELVTLDKWYQQSQNPQIKHSTQFVYPSLFWNEKQPAPFIDRWYVQQSEPQFKTYPQYRYSFVFTPIRQPVPQLSFWFQPASEPVRKKYTQYLYTFFEKELIQPLPAVPFWLPDYLDYVYDKKRQQFTYPSLFFFSNPITPDVDSWGIHYPQILFTKKERPVALVPFLLDIDAILTAPEMSWFVQNINPQKKKLLQYYFINQDQERVEEILSQLFRAIPRRRNRMR